MALTAILISVWLMEYLIPTTLTLCVKNAINPLIQFMNTNI